MFDFRDLDRPGTPNTALHADAGDTPSAAEEGALHVAAGPAEVVEAWDGLVRDEPRVRVEASEPAGGRHHCVQRSALFRFPDDVRLQAVAAPGGSRVLLYSASRVGRSDLGVNARRLRDWSAKLTAALDRR